MNKLTPAQAARAAATLRRISLQVVIHDNRWGEQLEEIIQVAERIGHVGKGPAASPFDLTPAASALYDLQNAINLGPKTVAWMLRAYADRLEKESENDGTTSPEPTTESSPG